MSRVCAAVYVFSECILQRNGGVRVLEVAALWGCIVILKAGREERRHVGSKSVQKLCEAEIIEKKESSEKHCSYIKWNFKVAVTGAVSF